MYPIKFEPAYGEMGGSLSAKSPSPHPVLQAALNSLDVLLEVELAQYRCHQIIRRLSPFACQISQSQINAASDETLLRETELAAATQPSENAYLNLDNPVDDSETTTLASSNPQAVSLPEPTNSSITLEAYLEFSQAYRKRLQAAEAVSNSRLRQGLCKHLAITAAVSLLLSILLSYVLTYLTSLKEISREICSATRELKHFCNGSPTLSDR